MTATTGFIGAGNMASSLIHRLVAQGMAPTSILAADPDTARLSRLQQACGIGCSTNQAIADSVDIIVLAVKPQVMKPVCQQLTLGDNAPLVLSVAAGTTLDNIQQWLGQPVAIVRCMPNTPALLGRGASGLFANEHTSPHQRQQAQQIMDAVGISLWVDAESELDAVTALSGSGPAYYFLFLEAMQQAAMELGLKRSLAEQLSLQTALGAAELAMDSADEVAELRRKVTSPGGTTERALQVFEAGGLRQLVAQALRAATARARELAAASGE